MKKKYASLLILATLASNAFAAWDGSTTEPFVLGDGSETNPFLLENEAQFVYFQKSVTDGEAYEGKYFRLNANLDFDGNTINPVGFHDDYILENVEVEESKFFLGVFDGNFMTINNVEIKLAVADEYEIGGVGIFAGGRDKTVIKNLIAGDKVKINGQGSPDVGGIMGVAYGSTIENCSFDGEILGGTVESGGIVGFAKGNSEISGCVFSGLLNANSFTGGIAGALERALVTDCLFNGTIDGNKGYWVAGIVGWAADSKVNNSLAIGKVNGIAGTAYLPGKSPVCAELERSQAKNCFYVESLTGCKPLSKQNGVTAISEEELKGDELLHALNGGADEGAWCADKDGVPAPVWTVGPTGAVNSPVAENMNVALEGRIIKASATQAVMTVYDIQGHVLYCANVEGEILYSPDYKGTIIVVLTDIAGKATVKKIAL